MLKFRKSPNRVIAESLYREIVAQARRPRFFSDLRVPDTLDGRFDMIVLHIAAVLYGLRRTGAEQALQQALFDVFMADMDSELREMGVGDLGVPKRIKVMARAFYGRAAQYDAAFALQNHATLQAALQKNIYQGVPDSSPQANRLAHYALQLVLSLTAQSLSDLSKGRLHFPPLHALERVRS